MIESWKVKYNFEQTQEYILLANAPPNATQSRNVQNVLRSFHYSITFKMPKLEAACHKSRCRVSPTVGVFSVSAEGALAVIDASDGVSETATAAHSQSYRLQHPNTSAPSPSAGRHTAPC